MLTAALVKKTAALLGTREGIASVGLVEVALPVTVNMREGANPGGEIVDTLHTAIESCIAKS